MKEIPEYEGHYKIDEDGNIFSMKYTKKQLKPSLSRKGYYQVVLSKDGKQKCWFIHILVAITYLNHSIGDKIVDHIDNNPKNNKLTNLQIISQRENGTKDRKRKYSKYRGVSYNNNVSKFVAKIVINKKTFNLGYFDTDKEASNAYEERLNSIN